MFQTLYNILRQQRIEIPIIQRDYAQGRNNDIATDIRSKFVHDLVTAISPNGSDIELDFVYGTFRNGTFEPLDGQQRLTTIFLLHWLCGVNLYDAEKKISLLSYETRNTSTDFCLELVKHSPKQFIEDIKQSYTFKKNRIDAAEETLKNLREIKKEYRYKRVEVEMLTNLESKKYQSLI